MKDKFGREVFEATCSGCGGTASVPFKPDGERPVYCRECFTERKKEQRQICIFISNSLVKKNMSTNEKIRKGKYSKKSLTEEEQVAWCEIISRNKGDSHAALREWMNRKRS